MDSDPKQMPRPKLAWIRSLLAPADEQRLIAGLFLRAVALIYLAAFASATLDIVGLVGESGILPAGDYLESVHRHHGDLAWLRVPTLFWIDHSDTALLGATYAGCLFSILLLLGWRPLLCTTLLFALYLSLSRVGQLFFNFQWDFLLLEAGLLSILLTQGPTRLLILLFHWLLFRLRFLSGLSKLMSEDPSWSGLTALHHYFETQPLPHVGSWYAHQLPEWMLKAGTGATLCVELVVPFFIFLPRPFRLFAAGATIVVQLLIIATSNHNFINLLTIALCLFLLDDRALRWLPNRIARIVESGRGRLATIALHRVMLMPLAALLVISSVQASVEFFAQRPRSEGPLATLSAVMRTWGQGNVYHVFPNMQTERQELTIEGSHDGVVWQAYRFKYKPNVASDRPAFILPLHPRLDWMIWFIPPQNPTMRPWFEAFLWRLHRGSPSVTSLLAHNPFPSEGPRYLRIQVHRFRFTTREERDRDGNLWSSQYLGQFPRVPPRRP